MQEDDMLPTLLKTQQHLFCGHGTKSDTDLPRLGIQNDLWYCPYIWDFKELIEHPINICPNTYIPEKDSNQVSKTPAVFSRIILLLRNGDVS